MTPLLMALEALSRMLENPHNEVNQEYAKLVLLLNGQNVPTFSTKAQLGSESYDGAVLPPLEKRFPSSESDVTTQTKGSSAAESFDLAGCPICGDFGLLPGNDIPCTCEAGKAYS